VTDIISAYSSEISSELSEYSEWARKKIRNCPNTPNDLGKKFGIVRILRIDLGKKFGIVRILRMTSEKNSEFRIKVGKLRVVLKLFNKCSLGIFSRYSSEFFSEWSSELFSEWSSELFSEWSSEIAPKVAKLMRKFSQSSSELSEYSEWSRKKIRNCPNTPNDLGKKFGIVRILRMTSEKNSEFRIKVRKLPPLFGKYCQIRKLFQAGSEKILQR
jgi:hypothetical protein